MTLGPRPGGSSGSLLGARREDLPTSSDAAAEQADDRVVILHERPHSAAEPILLNEASRRRRRGYKPQSGGRSTWRCPPVDLSLRTATCGGRVELAIVIQRATPQGRIPVELCVSGGAAWPCNARQRDCGKQASGTALTPTPGARQIHSMRHIDLRGVTEATR